MGWLAVDDPTHGRLLIHGGALENYQSFFCLIPERNIGFAFLMNQGGIMPMLSFNAIRDGLLAIVHGEPPDVESARRPLVIVTGIVLAVVGIGIVRTIRLRSRLSRREHKQRWRRRWGAGIELVWAGFLLLGFIPLMNAIMGDTIGWTTLYGLFPELFLLLLVSICLGFFRGCVKCWLLVRHDRSAERSTA